MYHKVYLLNKSISYTVDLSGADCACNAAFYAASLPGAKGGIPYPGLWNDYYCDGCSSDCGCPEMDFMEAVHTYCL